VAASGNFPALSDLAIGYQVEIVNEVDSIANMVWNHSESLSSFETGQ